MNTKTPKVSFTDLFKPLSVATLISLSLVIGATSISYASGSSGIEAESMRISGKGKVLSGSAASDGRVLFFWGKGAGVKPVFAEDTAEVEISARGKSCGGKFPIMSLKVGDDKIKEWRVSSRKLKTYEADLPQAARMDGKAQVSIVNPRNIERCSRGLIVDRIDFVSEKSSVPVEEPPVEEPPVEEPPVEEPPVEEPPVEEPPVEEPPVAGGNTCQSSLQSQINATPSGGTLVADDCIYREEVTLTKPITLVGQQNSEIRGSDVWSDWTASGSGWQSEKVLPYFSPGTDVYCNRGTVRCKWPEQVFVNGKPLTQVASSPSSGEFMMGSNRQVLLGENPAGKIVEVSTRRSWVIGKTANVKIENMTMKHAATEGRTAALMNRMGRIDKPYPNWVVENSTLSDAHGAVISLKGQSGLKILDNEIMRGGQIGIHGMGSGGIIRGNRIYDNNTENFESLGSPGLAGGGEAGGIKITEASNTLVTENSIYNNNGNGIHYDRWSQGTNTISNNRIYDNARRGIHYEVSRGGKIFGNVIYNNGWETPDWVHGAGIGVSNSSNVEVYNNTLAWNADGIAVVSLDRSVNEYDHVKDVRVYDNVILGQDDPNDKNFSFSSAWIQSWSNTMTNPEYNNRGFNNRYWNAKSEGTQNRFRWGSKSYSKLNSFQATNGEEGAIYMSSETKDNILDSKNLPRSSRVN